MKICKHIIRNVLSMHIHNSPQFYWTTNTVLKVIWKNLALIDIISHILEFFRRHDFTTTIIHHRIGYNMKQVTFLHYSTVRGFVCREKL